MYLTRAQFKNYKKICLKLRAPLDLAHLSKKTFLKLAKPKKRFRCVIQTKTKVCRNRVFLCKSVKRVGGFGYPKDNKIKKKINQLRMLELRICNELSKVNGNAQLQKKNGSTGKLFNKMHKCNQKSKGNKKKASQQIALTAVDIMNNDDDSTKSSKEDGGNLREKIRTQLELLRARKNDNNAFVTPAILNADLFETNIKKNVVLIELDTSKEYDVPSIVEKSAENYMEESETLNNKGIVDILYSKLNIKKDYVYRSAPGINLLNGSTTDTKNIEDPSIKLSLKNVVWDVMDDSSSSSSEFYGFDNEIYEVFKNLKHNPNLLATPHVSKVRPLAAFLADNININEITMERNEENINAKILMIVPNDKVGLANKFTIPKLTLTARPKDMQKPRTVAQKRALLEGNDIRYHMLDNECKIFCHLNRRHKSLVDGQPTPHLQIELMSSIQKQNMPFTRDSWRALAWLRTESSNYINQRAQWKGSEYKIIGSKGNHPKKSICFDSRPMKSVQNINSSYCNCTEFPKNLKINMNSESTNVSLVPSTTKSTDVISKSKEIWRLGKNIHDYRSKTKPGPMSFKIRQENKMAMDDQDCFLGTTHAYNMPQIKLKVCTKLNRPLNEEVIPVLKMILPHEKITNLWANFAVSTVITRSEVPKEGNTSKSNEFSFTIPYQNNQEKMFVRERKTHESLIPDDFNEKLTFADNVAEDDVLGNEIAQILTELTNSVAISLSQNNCVQEDVENDDNLEMAEVKKAKDDNELKITQKVLKKLKKLNAKIITAHDKKSEVKKVKDDNESRIIRKVLKKLKKLNAKIITANNKKAEIKEAKDEKELKIIRIVLKKLKKLDATIAVREGRDFAPTVVLTKNSPIHEGTSSQCRITTVAKKISDYESEEVTQQTTEKVKVMEILPKVNAEFDHLRHCKVNLQRLAFVNHIEPLCMVHWLYKCFCKNQSLTGEAFKFHKKKDFKSLVEDDTTDSNDDTTYCRKRAYTFDKTENSKYKKIRRNTIDSRQIQTTPENNFTIVHEPIGNDTIEIRNDNKIIPATSVSCVSRRVCPVNSKFYRARNLYSRERYIAESKKLIGSNKVKRKILLEKRIQRCEDFYHSQSLEHRVNYPKLLIKNVGEIPIYINVCDTDEKIQSNPIMRPLVNCNKVLLCINRNRYIIHLEENLDTFISGILDITSKISKSIPVCVIRRSQDTDDIKSTKDDRNKIENNFNTMQVLQLLRNLAINPSSNDNNDNITTSIASLLRSLKAKNQNERDSSSAAILNDKVYISNDAFRNVQTMNGRISSTMLKIHEMIFKNSVRIFHPQKGVLFLLKWEYLLVAFEDQLINIYEYENGNSPVKKHIITQMECSAEQRNFLKGCKNIRDLRNIFITKIPLEGSMISKMITSRIEGLSTKNLFLLLQGYPDYWIINGFLNTEKNIDPKSKISKPTPISHPQLSKTIMLYFKLMEKNNEIQEFLLKQKARNLSTQPPENACAINAEDEVSTASHTAVSEEKNIDTSRRERLSTPVLKIAMSPPRSANPGRTENNSNEKLN